jgi:hypothetical protein
MRSFQGKVLKSLFPLIALTFLGAGPHRAAVQGSTQLSADGHQYFQPGPNPASIIAAFLPSLGEPSLYEAAKDPNLVSLRASFFSPIPAHAVAVRLVVDADGSGQIISAVLMDSKSGVKKTQNDVSANEVSKLLQLLAKADFWSIPSVEDPGPKTDAAGHKVYVIDGPHWMVEAAREGSFHYVYRYTPKTSPVTEIACHLAKDVASSDDSTISKVFCTPRGQ